MRSPSAWRQKVAAGLQLNSAGYDDWGLNLETAEQIFGVVRWLYRHYFRVRCHGIKDLPSGRVMFVANHGGQIPLDGALIAMALAYDAEPPRLVRSMVERWFPVLPFVSSVFTRTGQVVGDPRNCRALLEQDQAVLVFPEGVRGSGKPFQKRYELQHFGTGFLRLAAETGTPVVPVGVIGSEEIYPGIFHLDRLARLLGVPYIPITPLFPHLGLLGLLPLPVRVDLHFGQPLRFDLKPEVSDAEVQGEVDRVMQALADLLGRGVARRPGLHLISKLLGQSL